MARTVPDSHIYSQADRDLLFTKFAMREKILISWAGLRGTDRPGYISRSGGNQAWRIVLMSCSLLC